MSMWLVLQRVVDPKFVDPGDLHQVAYVRTETVEGWSAPPQGYHREFDRWLMERPDTVYRDNDDPMDILKRPGDLDAARAWCRENMEAEGNRKMFLDAFDLMEKDPEVWFYASY